MDLSDETDNNYENVLIDYVVYFFIGLLISLVLASFGVSVGFRKLYVKVLLKIFDVIMMQFVPSACFNTFGLLLQIIVRKATY